MVMDTLQIRLSHGLVERIDLMVKTGIYANRSDVVRDAVRRFVWEREVGSITKKGNSLEIIRNVRNKLSKEKTNLEEINNL
ncbi:ribbon-helix-helix protein, CopG family [Candidatus Woesearchaeota archaeon]|nr:ribbon-helix-helix protein, CopG family [Candidatus Woesearchaeota archaeon]